MKRHKSGKTKNKNTTKKSLLVRFLALVTTMVTKVDHCNHRSNDCGNHRSNHYGYYDSYYDGNTFFVEEYIFLDDFLRF